MKLFTKHSRRALVLSLLVCGSWGVTLAQGYKDVTAQVLVNPSFELSDVGTSLPGATANDLTEAYGWTLPPGTSNMAVADAATTAVGFTNNKGGVSPSDGSFFLWFRKGWGNLQTVVSTITPYVCRYKGSRITFLGSPATVSRPVEGGVLTGVIVALQCLHRLIQRPARGGGRRSADATAGDG